MEFIIVTEAIQNIIEHGYGPYAEISLEINNLAPNPYFKISFKHEMEPGKAYTLPKLKRMQEGRYYLGSI